MSGVEDKGGGEKRSGGPGGQARRQAGRQDRLEAQLRENLRKRKEQARARAHATSDNPSGTSSDQET